LNDIILPNEKFTFLIGAGISIEAPSHLKSAVDIVNAIINLCAVEDEVSKIVSLQGLRYETVIEFIQKYYDPELTIMNYFDHYTQPNIHHYLLAYSIRQGHHVITTNFDYLIECALMNIIDDKNKIVPIITRNDFLNYSDPNKLTKEEKYAIYKIHGSKKNIITNTDTHDSLITTISSLGRERDEKTFAIEDYKKPALVNLLEKRTLIVMGYSGNDDFDISPTLKELENISKIIWINHASNEIPEIINIDEISDIESAHIDRATSLLKDLAQNSTILGHPIKIFKINVNTGIFVRNYLWESLLDGIKQPNLSEIAPVEFDYEIWFQETLKPIDEVKKLLFTWELYYRLGHPDDALRIGERGLTLAEQQGNIDLISSFLNHSGLIYLDKGQPEKALDFYKKALALEPVEGRSMILNNIAMVYKSQRDYQNAILWLKKALEVSEGTTKVIEKITILNNLGLTYYSDGKYQEAFEYYEQTLEMNRSLGDLGVKSRLLSNIGSVYFSQNNYEDALDKFQEALQISEELGDLNGVSVRLNNIASIYSQQGNKKLALEYYEKALEKVEILGDLAKKAVYLSNMALVYSDLSYKDKAAKLLDLVLPIDKHLDDKPRILFDLKNAGTFYKDIGEYESALKRYEEALGYYQEANDLGGIAGTYNDIAMVYYNQGRLAKAIETLETVINIAIQAGYASSPEFQDITYGLSQLKEKYVFVADLEDLFKKWEKDRLPQIQLQLNELNLENLVKTANNNPYILEEYLWEKNKGKVFLEKILELLPKEINEEPVLNVKGFLLAFLANHDEALTYFEQALTLNPRSIIATTGIAFCKINKKEIHNALNLLEPYKSINNYLILYLFSLAYLRLNDLHNAEAHAKIVLELKPDFLPALNILGTIYFLKKELETAQKYFQDALNLNPTFLKPYSNLGIIYYTQHQYEKAEDIFKSLLTLDITDSYRLNMLARIYFNTQQPERVEWVLKRMLLFDPKNMEALESLAGQYYNAGNYRKAEIYYKKAIDLDPSNLKILELLMNTYRGMGNLDRATEVQKKISELNT
jgi:tetratricopeptide (TPR) repeat protein